MKPYILLALAAVVITACDDNNHLRSRTPVLFRADEAALPTIPDGVWVSDNPGCAFEPARPVSHWPSCVDGIVVKGGKAVFPESNSYDALSGLTRLQIGPGLQIGQEGPGDPGAASYGYYGVEVLAAGSDGRPRLLRSFSLLCGPRPPEDSRTSDGKRRTQTLEPYAGVVLDENGCAPLGRAGLISAAFANRARAAADPGRAVRWVREEIVGDRDERVDEAHDEDPHVDRATTPEQVPPTPADDPAGPSRMMGPPA
jgi:hypothetical protein